MGRAKDTVVLSTASAVEADTCPAWCVPGSCQCRCRQACLVTTDVTLKKKDTPSSFFFFLKKKKLIPEESVLDIFKMKITFLQWYGYMYTFFIFSAKEKTF